MLKFTTGFKGDMDHSRIRSLFFSPELPDFIEMVHAHLLTFKTGFLPVLVKFGLQVKKFFPGGDSYSKVTFKDKESDNKNKEQ